MVFTCLIRMRKVGLYLIEERLYDLIRSIFEKVDYVKLSQLDEAGEETERPILIFTSIIMAQTRVVEDPKAISYLSDISKELKVSTSWLSMRFKEIFGISFCQLLAKIKCCQALWELISSDKLIKQIALNIGYMPLYFSQLFRSNFGSSPSFVRKQLIPRLAQF